MSRNELRRSQLLTSFGPGALVDLPEHAVIVSGTEHWYYETGKLAEHIVEEPRLVAKLSRWAEGRAVGLRLPPIVSEAHGAKAGVKAFLFPQWCVVQYPVKQKDGSVRRRLIHRKNLDPRTATTWRDPDAGKPVKLVPMRFIRACKKGHIDDINWREFVHQASHQACPGSLWLEESGTTGGLADLKVICECGASRKISDVYSGGGALGPCSGERPWMGAGYNEACDETSRILVRSATNAHFPLLLSVISIPDGSSALAKLVDQHWAILQVATSPDFLRVLLQSPALADLAGVNQDEVWTAIQARRSGAASQAATPVKDLEFDAFAKAPPTSTAAAIDSDFVVRQLDPSRWPRLRRTGLVDRIVLADRLREVSAMVGFTRVAAMSNEINGELNDQVVPAKLGESQDWFPAGEVRGEGLFLGFSAEAMRRWMSHPKVDARAQAMRRGFDQWQHTQGAGAIAFPGIEYYLLHSLAHLLMTAIALECGYPLSSLKERIYSEPGHGNYGILLYSGASDAEGTLGGIVQAGEGIERHLLRALTSAELCSGDPICSHHSPEHADGRNLQGAACHGCLYVPETSCEQRNEFLDRSLVVRTLESLGCEYFDEHALRELRA